MHTMVEKVLYCSIFIEVVVSNQSLIFFFASNIPLSHRVQIFILFLLFAYSYSRFAFVHFPGVQDKVFCIL